MRPTTSKVIEAQGRNASATYSRAPAGTANAGLVSRLMGRSGPPGVMLLLLSSGRAPRRGDRPAGAAHIPARTLLPGTPMGAGQPIPSTARRELGGPVPGAALSVRRVRRTV